MPKAPLFLACTMGNRIVEMWPGLSFESEPPPFHSEKPLASDHRSEWVERLFEIDSHICSSLHSVRNNLELLITDAAREYLDKRKRPVALDYMAGLG